MECWEGRVHSRLRLDVNSTLSWLSNKGMLLDGIRNFRKLVDSRNKARNVYNCWKEYPPSLPLFFARLFAVVTVVLVLSPGLSGDNSRNRYVKGS